VNGEDVEKATEGKVSTLDANFDGVTPSFVVDLRLRFLLDISIYEK
jgi:hypothetical protein